MRWVSDAACFMAKWVALPFEAGSFVLHGPWVWVVAWPSTVLNVCTVQYITHADDGSLIQAVPVLLLPSGGSVSG